MTTFTPQEIQATYDSGQQIAAIKMLRAETGCGLVEARNALIERRAGNMPTFAEREAKKKVEAAAPELLAALEDIVKRNEIQHWFNLDQAKAAIKKARD